MVIVATLGTSHYRFDRLIGWLDDWMLEHGGDAYVQHGASRRPSAAMGVEMMERDALLTAMRAADVVVSHGGTGSIMDAAACGKTPIVVPRVSALGENVDDHQVSFARRLSETGRVHLAETRDELYGHLRRAVDEPEAYRSSGQAERLTARPQLESILVNARSTPAGYLRWRRVGHLIRGAHRRRGASR